MSSMWTSSINSTWEPLGGMSNPPPKPLSSHFPPPQAACPGWAPILTPGMISALPSSRHSATLALICSRTSDLISPVSPWEAGVVRGGSERRQGPRAGGWMKTEKDGTPRTEGRQAKTGVAKGQKAWEF